MKTLPLLVIMMYVISAQLGVAQEVVPSAASRFEQRDTEAIPDFQKHVVPLLGRLGCNAAKCHGSFQGQGDFRLSLFGFDFQADHSALHANASTEGGQRIDRDAPAESLILLKPTKQIRHGGGKVYDEGSWEHHLLRRWIEAGAQGAPVLETREASPSSQTKETSFSAAGIEFFKDKIRPLLESNCYECHGFNNRKGGFQLNSHQAMLKGGSSGAAIVPGKPDKSLLIEAVRHSNPDLQMPPKRKLEAQEIADLEEWIRMGAPWASGSDGAPVKSGKVLARLHYEPEEILFREADDTSQIRVIAEWADGEREDVTCLARFRSNNDGIVLVDADGLATATGMGDTHIVAFYDNGVAAVPVLLPYGRSYSSNAKRMARVADGTGTVPATNPIDLFVEEKLGKLGIRPSGTATDAEFLRRVSIDMCGSLPSPTEIVAFLADAAPGKRRRKIDELLERSTYAAWWANKLCDFTGCNPAAINSAQEVALEAGYVKASQWYDWIYERVAGNEPYDNLVAGIMLADLPTPNARFRQRGMPQRMDGRSGDSPGKSAGMPWFWTRQSLKEPKDTAISVAHSFLGIQLQCAECHKHPFDQWTQNDFVDFSDFFRSMGSTKGKERSSSNPSSNEARTLSLLRSGTVTLSTGDDPRKPIMSWMREKENPWFARAFVNRVWAGYFYVGIVDPPDQFTSANPPSNPLLLMWLTKGFVESGYDMKWLHRQITGSKTYQRSWKPNESNADDRRNYSRAIPRRIPAEVVYDAMKQATVANDRLSEVRNNLQRRASGHLSMRMAGTHAMNVFGKPERSINCDCERVNEPTLLQAIFLQNDPLVRMRLADSGWIAEIEEAAKAGSSVTHQQLIEQVWLRTVNRPPTDEDRRRALEHLASVDSISEGVIDLMWAMLNTKEFMLNH